jgi:hypothetical protein
MDPFDHILSYLYDGDTAMMEATIIKHPEALGMIKQGYGILHHIVKEDDQRAFELYMRLGGNPELKTATHFFCYNGLPLYIVGGQSACHIANFYASKQVMALCKGQCHTIDEIGNLPDVYQGKKNDAKFHMECYNRLRRLYPKFTVELSFFRLLESFDDKLVGEFNEVYRHTIREVPNSMHRTGVVFSKENDNLDKIYPIVKKILSELEVECNLYDVSVYGFTAEYDNTSNLCLDEHVDNSTLTINLCFECSEDLEGTELYMCAAQKTVPAKQGQVIVHHGRLRHLVHPLKKGFRKNLIVWIR